MTFILDKQPCIGPGEVSTQKSQWGEDFPEGYYPRVPFHYHIYDIYAVHIPSMYNRMSSPFLNSGSIKETCVTFHFY